MTEYFKEQLDLCQPPVAVPTVPTGDDWELPAPQCDRDSDETCESCQ